MTKETNSNENAGEKSVKEVKNPNLKRENKGGLINKKRAVGEKKEKTANNTQKTSKMRKRLLRLMK